MLGVPVRSFRENMVRCVEKELIRLRSLLLEYANMETRFIASLDPLPMPDMESGVAVEIRTMISCGLSTGTGPMASVAGLFAQQVGKKLLEEYGLSEVMVENGGDLYVRNVSGLLSVVHAGVSSLSDRLAFKIPAGEWGICTSSGTMGHSFSRGKADAVTVITHSAPLADAWATALANQLSSASDMDELLETVAGIPEIRGFAAIIDDRMGICGELEVKMLTWDR